MMSVAHVTVSLVDFAKVMVTIALTALAGMGIAIIFGDLVSLVCRGRFLWFPKECSKAGRPHTDELSRRKPVHGPGNPFEDR